MTIARLSRDNPARLREIAATTIRYVCNEDKRAKWIVKRTARVANSTWRRQHKRTLAKRLRENATDAERILWSHLRAKQVAGLRFRRQHPIGPYIADFYCSAAKLIVELDGSQHGEPENHAYDAARDRWLQARGYRVLRFDNIDFLKNRELVLDEIFRAIIAAGTPLPMEVVRLPSYS